MKEKIKRRQVVHLMTWMGCVALLAGVARTWGQAEGSGTAIMQAQAVATVARARDLAGQIEELDRDIEKRVDRIIRVIKPVRDSTESKTRIANLKEDVMTGLVNSIEFYHSQRAKRVEMLKRPTAPLPTDDLIAEIDYLDERTEDRIDQVLEIASSLTTHDNFKKYERTHSGRRSRGRGRNQTVSKKYRQNKRVGSKTAATKESIVEGLSENMEDLEKQSARLEQLEPRARTEEQKERIEEAIEKKAELVEKREEQIESVVTGASRPTKQVGSREAHSLEQMVRDEVEGIRKSFDELVRLNSEYDRALGELRSLKLRLSYVD